MAASSAGLHESADSLGPEVIDQHRATVSIMEELEAIDWYNQRVHASSDPALVAVLAHNRDEEKEHACMTLEWLRRHDSVLDTHLRTYLFTDAPIVEEERAEAGGTGGPAQDGSLGIGSLRGMAQ
jgi:ferritin-like protein